MINKYKTTDFRTKRCFLIFLHVFFMSMVFSQPDQEYINQFKGIEYTGLIHQKALNLQPGNLNWNIRKAQGFNENITDFHRKLAGIDNWSFTPVDNNGNLKGTVSVDLPHEYPANRDFHAGWYIKKINLNKEEDTRYFLKLERVDLFSKLVVNEQVIGQHFGSFTPFEFDITEALKNGNNLLALYVHDQTASVDGKKAYNQLGVRRPWNFNPTGGLQAKPLLEKRNAVYLKDLFIITSTRERKMIIEYKISNSLDTQVSTDIQFEVFQWPGGESVSLDIPVEKKVLDSGKTRQYSIAVPWPDAELWSPENPNLYILRTSLENNNQQEMLDTRFGFREFWVDGKQFMLNGKPVRLRGSSTYKKGIDGYEAHLEEFLDQKEFFDVNACRIHGQIKTSEINLAADEAGILLVHQSSIWSVMNHYYRNGGEWFLANIKKEFEEWVNRDKNSPSVVIWDVENEMIRANTKNIPWVLKLKDYVLEIDTTRPVNFSGAGWFDEKQDMVHLHMQEHYTRIMNDWKNKGERPLIMGEFWVGGRGSLSRLPSSKEFDNTLERFKEAAGIYKEKLLEMRKFGVAGIMPFMMVRYYPNERLYPDWEKNMPLKHGLQAMTAFFWPRQDYLPENQSVSKELILCNDSERSKDFEVSWGIKGKETNEETFTLEPGQQHQISVSIPPVNKDIKLFARLTVNGKLVTSDSISYNIIPDSTLQKPDINREILIYQSLRAEEVKAKLPLPSSITVNIPANPQNEMLIIPPEASNRELYKKENELKEFVSKGGRILCFKQQQALSWSPVKLEFWSATQPAPDTYKGMGWNGINRDLFFATKVPILAKSHPIFKGIHSEFLNRWSTFDGRVSDDVLLRPSLLEQYHSGAWRALASGTQREHMTLAEARIEEGLMLFCQAQVMDYSSNPQAKALLNNMLAYLDMKEPWEDNKSVELTGEANKEQIKEYMNAPEASFNHAKPKENEWMIATHNSSISDIKNWAENGGPVLVLSEKITARFQGIETKKEGNYVYTASKNSDHPLFYGISSGNFLHELNPFVEGYISNYPSNATILLNGFKIKKSRTERSPINTLDIEDAGPVAISIPYGKSEIILTTLTPWKAGTAYGKELFTTFLANSGVNILLPEETVEITRILETIPLEMDGQLDDWTNDMEDQNISQYVHADPVMLTAENAISGNLQFDLEFSGIAYGLHNENALYLAGMVFGEERTPDGLLNHVINEYQAEFHINDEEITIIKKDNILNVTVNGNNNPSISSAWTKISPNNFTDTRSLQFHYIHKSGNIKTVNDVKGESFEVRIPWEALNNSKLKEESSVKMLIRYMSDVDTLQLPRDAELDNTENWRDIKFEGQSTGIQNKIVQSDNQDKAYLFPNPVKGNTPVNLFLPDKEMSAQEVIIKAYDSNGILLFESVYKPMEVPHLNDINKLNEGIYFIKIQYDRKKYFQKLIKHH